LVLKSVVKQSLLKSVVDKPDLDKIMSKTKKYSFGTRLYRNNFMPGANIEKNVIASEVNIKIEDEEGGQ
jgi:hypothetical protein